MNEKRVERYGYKCQKPECKHYWILEFEVEETGKQMWQYGKWTNCVRSTLLNPCPEWTATTEMTAEHLLAQPPRYWRSCPKCKSSWVKVRRIVGHVDPKVPCDDRCTHAEGDKCRCSCGGVHHGMAYVVAFREVAHESA